MVVAQRPLKGTAPVPQQRPFLRRDTATRLLYLQILEAEDRRTLRLPSKNVDDPKYNIVEFLKRSQANVRRRAAIAIGRIGDPTAVAPLLERLAPVGDTAPEPNADVRAALVFALGEIEDMRAVPKLLELLADTKTQAAIRARAAEALGKIGANATAAAALGQPRLQQMNAAVAAALPSPDRDVVGDELLLGSLAITALLRLKQPEATAPLTAMLASRSSVLRWHAANAVARLRPEAASAPDAVTRLTAMLKAQEPIERANGARGLGAMKAAAAVESLIGLLGDTDDRVRVSAVRALAGIGDARAAAPLGALGDRLLAGYAEYVAAKQPGVPPEQNLLLDVATALGTLKDPSSLPLLARMRVLDGRVGANPETEIAVAAYGEAPFFEVPAGAGAPSDWQHVSNYAQGLGAVGGERAKRELLDALAGRRFGPLDARAVPEVLNALAKLKVEGLERILVEQLGARDVAVRATAAGLLAEHAAPGGSAALSQSLEAALKASATDTDLDARLALLDAIAKLKVPRSNELLNIGLESNNYLVWRRAAALLDEGGKSSYLSLVPERTVPARRAGFYERAEALMRRPSPIAVLTTEKGDIRLELLAHEAPLTVDSFVSLARKNYFDGVAFHRVVPNFVVQGGDPRGDGNGGPGYQIRCEINMAPYDRGAVGMALSGKDTGGSQFFVTHSPQPHLDGGYTVFARVTAGMDVVDRLARGDRILSVNVIE
jgi:cyclophilin family peptidyl-prolyl cis-trans isomerase